MPAVLRTLSVAAAVALFAHGAAPATAQISQNERVESIIRALTPPPAAQPEPSPPSLSRTIRLEPVEVPDEVEPPPATVVSTEQAPRSVSFNEITFEFNSHQLTRAAQPYVDDIGLALQSPNLAPYSFLIAGHTDAVGSAGYNQELSERRAAAVRDWLVERHRVDPMRLRVQGFGEEQLALPAAPDSAANRRVEVRLISNQVGAVGN